MSIHQACGLFHLSETVYYYKAKSKDDDHIIEDELRSLAEVHTNWGFWLMFYNLRMNHYTWNHKRVYRVYKNMKLNMRRKYKRRLPARVKEPLLQPLMPNVTWSMDFMHDMKAPLIPECSKLYFLGCCWCCHVGMWETRTGYWVGEVFHIST
jgi:putative transposase